MSFKKSAESLSRIHQMILDKRTGDHKELAEKLNVSSSTVYRYIDTIKSYGITVKYDNSIRSYYYQEGIEVNYSCGFTFKRKNED